MAQFSKQAVEAKIAESPLIPVFYSEDLAYAQNIIKACYEGGMKLFEFTNRGPKAFEMFGLLKAFVAAECPEMALGIGTIYNAIEAERFIEAGADFLVQPITTAEVAEVCQQYDIPWIPGVMTLNEMHNAYQLGAPMVKIFPGNAVGPDYVKAVRGPMPFVKIMVTGGVEPNEANLKGWFDAGVTCVGMGSQLFKGDFSADFSPLSTRIRQLLDFVVGGAKE